MAMATTWARVQSLLLALPAGGDGDLRQGPGPGVGPGAADVGPGADGGRVRSGRAGTRGGDGCGHRPGRRLMPRAGLDSQAVVAAAAELADKEGLEAVTLA